MALVEHFSALMVVCSNVHVPFDSITPPSFRAMSKSWRSKTLFDGKSFFLQSTFSKIAPSPRHLFNQTLQFLQVYVKNVHPVYGTEIRTLSS